MSTDNATLHSPSPTTGRGERQKPPHPPLRNVLIVALVLLLLLAGGGLVWRFLLFPQGSCSPSKAADPTRPGAVSEYCLPGNDRNYGAMTVGPDGNLWFTGNIVRVTPQGVLTQFPVKSPPSYIPLPGIARGPDGNLWYIAGTTLGRINPQGQPVAAVSMPARVRYITGLAAAPDGTLWVGLATGSETDQLTSEIAKVTASGQVSEIALPKEVAPTGGLVAGADGNLWVAATDTSIGRITPSGQFTEFPVKITHPPLVQLTRGPDGNIWFIDAAGGVGRITSTGAVTLFPTAEQANVGAPSIGAGPDGNVWFSVEPGTIARITPSGAVTRFALPHDRDVVSITAGPDGGVWFLLVASTNVTRVVRITP